MSSVVTREWPAEAVILATPQMYQVYGLRVESELKLGLNEAAGDGPADVRLTVAPGAYFDTAADGAAMLPDGGDEAWYQHAFLRDGRVYLRWEGLFEFVVSADGRQVWCGSLGAETIESFQVYLLGHALGFALTLMGEEPLHATVVVKRGRAVGLLGDCGAGKSTLAACLLSQGWRLVTDDLLRVTIEDGVVWAHPGPQRVKLLPEAKERYLAAEANGVEMNPMSGKFVVPLPVERGHDQRAPLTGLFLLDWPEEGEAEPRICSLNAKAAFLGLVGSTFNRRMTEPGRLARQFRFAEKLNGLLPLRRLAYAREFDRMPAVAVLMEGA